MSSYELYACMCALVSVYVLLLSFDTKDCFEVDIL